MGPRTAGGDGRFIPRVKPMYFCHERDVVAYAKKTGLPVKFGECPCSSDAYRREMKALFKELGEEAKENVLRHFLRIAPALKHVHAAPEARSCEACGEPAAGELCNACLILAKLKE
jgi:uncharacterized protein (TIGR00269 family)